MTMSLILEALRKSEAERRRGQAPDVTVELSPPPVAGRVNMRRWLWPVLALVTLFALVPVLAIWWIARDSWVPDAAPADAAEAGAAVVAPEPGAEPAPAIVPREPAAMPAPTPALPMPAQMQTPAPVPTVPVTLPADAAPIPAPAPAPSEVENPPSVGMSGVRLSMHLWNEDPARRLVVLNGQRMTEGDRHGAITLVEILRDGVVVERDGLRARVDLP